MTLFKPIYRLTVFAPRSVDPTETTILTPAVGALHNDAFRIITMGNVPTPLLAAIPPVISPAAGEPTYNAATDLSTFYDDFESYANTAGLLVANGGKYWTSAGSYALIINAGNGYLGSNKFVRFDYTAPATAVPNTGYANEIYTTQHHNAALATAQDIVLSYGYRNIGNWYESPGGGTKEFIIRSNAGQDRYVLITDSYFIEPKNPLQNCWYTPDYPYDPLNGSVPPRVKYQTWSRDLDLTLAPGGPAPHFLSGNMGYPAVQFEGVINDGNWHRKTWRFGKERAGRGTGRLEGWLDGVKFMEYIGDDPLRCEYGNVWTWNDENTVWDGDMYFCGTMSGHDWGGGALVDYDGLRLWVPG
jgi:hypothetical protein